MKRFYILALLALAACSNDPLSQRVDHMEQQVAQMRTQMDADQETLLARLDQIAVTPENADEVGAIRAKLRQTDISSTQFVDLQRRVRALERVSADVWSQAVLSLQHSVYAVLHGVLISEGNVEITFVATGFAVDPTTLITNCHVVEGLKKLDKATSDFNRRYSTQLTTAWIVARNLTTVLHYKSNYYFIGKYKEHPQWNPKDHSSVDVAGLRIAEGRIYRTVDLASRSDVLRLRIGQPIGTLGFPGELQGGSLSSLFPMATFKNGTISALRPPFEGRPYTYRDTYIVQHNLDLSGGTSGSPIFNPSGTVIAVNNAGIEGLVLTLSGQPTRISQAALGFGIRADKIHDVLDQMATAAAAKPVSSADLRGQIQALEGRDLNSLRIAEGGGDLGQRLAGRLGVEER